MVVRLPRKEQMMHTNFTIWLMLGFISILAGLGFFVDDFHSLGEPQYNYSSFFVVAGAMFALHVLEINMSLRNKERAEDRSMRRIDEINSLAKSVKADIVTDAVGSINLRFRNAASKFDFIDRLLRSDDLTDFDRERGLFYRDQLKEEIRAHFSMVHPCFFYGEVYESSSGKPYSSSDFKYRDHLNYHGEEVEIFACEIELERLLNDGFKLSNYDFLFYSNAQDILDKIDNSTPLKTYIESFKGVWLEFSPECVSEEGLEAHGVTHPTPPQT
jgi:hypothetical protein